ncbi:MAG: TolC family protein [Spirochaetia bacterium]
MKQPLLCLESFLLLLSMFWQGSTGAAAEAISVAEAIQQAQESDLQLQQIEKRLHQARSSLSPQLRARLPRVFVEYEGSESYGLEEPYRLTHKLGVGIEVELTDQGSSWFSEQEKARKLEQLKLEIRLRREAISSQITELCLNILYSKTALKHMEQLLELYSRHLHSADQQHTSATISAQRYRRLGLEYETKQLEVGAEELRLQNLYSRLELSLGSESPPTSQLKGSLPRFYTGSIGSQLPSQPAFYKEAAQKNNTEVIQQEIRCRTTADRYSLALRQFCPQTLVFARIDFMSSEFPPASPSLSFGLQLSGGAGKMEAAAGNTSNYSSYTYAGSSSAHGAVDFSQKTSETRSMLRLQLQQARQKLQVARSSASTRALRLYGELSHLKEVQKNLLAQTQLHRESCSIKADQFDFGDEDLRDLVETHQTYTDSLLELYRISRSCLEMECSLLQTCGLSRYIPGVLKSLSPESYGGSHALQQ